MNTKIKYGLSAAVLALIAAGAPAPDILDQFLDEKEGKHTTAYRDGAGIWMKRRTKNAKTFHDKCENFNFRASNETAALTAVFLFITWGHFGYG